MLRVHFLCPTGKAAAGRLSLPQLEAAAEAHVCRVWSHF